MDIGSDRWGTKSEVQVSRNLEMLDFQRKSQKKLGKQAMYMPPFKTATFNERPFLPNMGLNLFRPQRFSRGIGLIKIDPVIHPKD